MPYEISRANNNTLVIGSGGGEDVLVALAGGAKNVTAVELNPLIISAAKRFLEV
jgi:predicted RNA methylase